jgi:drug/metabolite transporter (DMT)-like permease
MPNCKFACVLGISLLVLGGLYILLWQVDYSEHWPSPPVLVILGAALWGITCYLGVKLRDEF